MAHDDHDVVSASATDRTGAPQAQNETGGVASLPAGPGRAADNAAQSAHAPINGAAAAARGSLYGVLRHSVALAVACALVVLLCGCYPPKETGSGGSADTAAEALSRAPPLPVVDELGALASFVTSSLDDASEDAAKALCVYGAHRIGGALAVWALPITRGGRLPRVARAVAGPLLGFMVYPWCDVVSDRVGDQMQLVQNSFRRSFGLEEKVPTVHAEAMTRNLPLVATIVDDAVEDIFKASCLLMHARVGSLVGDVLIQPVLETLPVPGAAEFAWAAGKVVIMSSVAGRYMACDEFGDALGDAAQDTTAAALGAPVSAHAG